MISCLPHVLLIIKQVKELIQCIPSDYYTQKEDFLMGSSVGMHIRHIVEYYQCLVNQHTTGEIAYDKRKRDLKIETDPSFALLRMNEVEEEINPLRSDTPLKIWSEAPEGLEGCYSESSLKRELIYITDHSVHHMAIVKMALKVAQIQVCLDEKIGVAASTLNYQAQQECAR